MRLLARPRRRLQPTLGHYLSALTHICVPSVSTVTAPCWSVRSTSRPASRESTSGAGRPAPPDGISSEPIAHLVSVLLSCNHDVDKSTWGIIIQPYLL